MKCEAEYCLYNQDYQCTLQSIEINSLGMCAECMLVLLDKDFLEREKARQLSEIRKQEAGWKK